MKHFATALFLSVLCYGTIVGQQLPSNNYWKKPSLEEWLYPNLFLTHSTFSPPSTQAVPCDCTIEQLGFSANISSLLGTLDPVAYYDYGGTFASSANTGLEAMDMVRIFLYEDPSGNISLFFILDIQNNGTGGTAALDFECLPAGSSVIVSDDAGEFTGAAPNIVADFFWQGCCTDGGVIGGMGCGNTFDIYLSNVTGINGVQWVTGDINNPTIIDLPSITDRIRVDCGGGGVCCPSDLDVTINAFNTDCPNTANGSATVSPNKGTPPYSYLWSNGNFTATANNLMEGTYMVTITDADGCMDIVSLNIGANSTVPIANGTSLEECADAIGNALFDLSQAEPAVGIGNISWYADPGLTMPISSPYPSSGTIVYAVISNGFCNSDPAPVALIVNPLPLAGPAFLSACDIGTGEGIFDLTEASSGVSSGLGVVTYYSDPGLIFPISPPNVFVSPSTTVYATVFDGNCESLPAEVELAIIPAPLAISVTLEACATNNGQATFDLTSINDQVNGGTGNTVNWYIDPGASVNINNPGAFTASTITVYATVYDGECTSQAVAIDLLVDEIPMGNPGSVMVCGDTSSTYTFNLDDYSDDVGDGSSAVNWYTDMAANNPIINTDSFPSGTATIYAILDNGFCSSAPVPYNLVVNTQPVAVSDTLSVCADTLNQFTFDLTALDSTINDSTNFQVTWFQNAIASDTIMSPDAYTTITDTVYAIVNNGFCDSETVPVFLNVLELPTSASASITLCETANGEATFNLQNLEGMVSGGVGTVLWYLDDTLLNPVTDPANFQTTTTTVFATVTNGNCTSDPAMVDLTVALLPIANTTSTALCEISNDEAAFDLSTLETTVSGGAGSVQWFIDAQATQLINTTTNYITGTTTIYATVDNGDCISLAVPVDLNVLLLPETQTASIAICDEGNSSAIFDLTSLENTISGGNGLVSWYEDVALVQSIANPDAYESGNNTVFATVDNGTCISDPVPISIGILSTPIATSTSESLCETGNDQATFDLSLLALSVFSGVGTVFWYEDAAATQQIADPNNYISSTTTIFAQVDNTACTSNIVPVDLTVLLLPDTNPASQMLCEENNGVATFDLATLAQTVSGGSGNITWYTDAGGSNPLGLSVVYPTISTTIFATVDDGNCVSSPQAVDLIVLPLPVANSLTIEDCDDGSGGASLDLDDYALSINPDGADILWYEDAALQNQITNTNAYFTGPTTLYAFADDGACQSAAVPIDVDITLSVAPMIECIFTSIDSVYFEWDMVGIEYEVSYSINAGTTVGPFTVSNNYFGIGGLLEADEVVITVGVIVDPDCPPVAFSTASCIADSCPLNPILFNNLEPEYCNTDGVFTIDVSPAGGTLMVDGVTTDSFDPSIYSGAVQLIYNYTDPATTCEYADTTTVAVVQALEQPLLECTDATTQSLTFIWNEVGAIAYEIVYAVNGNPPITFTTNELSFLLDGLSDEDIVTLTLTPLGDPPCGNGPSIQAMCSTLPCPPPALAVDFLYTSYCADGPTIDLPLIYPNGSYSGDGIDGMSFDPSQVMGSLATISFTYTDTMTNCTYTIEGTTAIIQSLEPPLVNCVAMTDVSVTFSWDATSDLGEYSYTYTVNGMNPVSGVTTQTTLEVVDIFPDNVVEITVIALGSQPCGNSEPANGSCSALPCPDVSIIIDGMAPQYCSNEDAVQLMALPAGGVFSGEGINGAEFSPSTAGLGPNTILYTYTDPANMCVYVDSVQTTVFAPIPDPVISCGPATTQSVSFSWLDVGAGSYEVSYSINGQLPIIQTISTTTLDIPNLNPEDVVDISVTAIGLAPCGNSPTATQSCSALPCPEVNFSFTEPGLICDTDEQFMLEVAALNQSTTAVLIWSGDGIVNTNGLFDPASANIGINNVTVSLTEIGCFYDTTFVIEVLPTPVSAFTSGDLICLTDTLTVIYEGAASPDASLIWDFDDGNLVSGAVNGVFELIWNNPGIYTISLMIDDEGCLSETISQQVEVVAPLEEPVINCGIATTQSVSFSWTDVGADEYELSYAINGQPPVIQILMENMFELSGLSPEDVVNISVIALGAPPCGNSPTATQTCSALPCPDVSFALTDPGLLCAIDEMIQLEVNVINQSTAAPAIWSGDGIVSSEGMFDPATANIGQNQVFVSLSEIGCVYDTTFMIEVLPTPIAAFTAGNRICSDSTLSVIYQGTATADAALLWDFDGGSVVSGPTDGSFELMWGSPGVYTISLQIDDEGCVSETINQIVEVVAPLIPTPINCAMTDLTSLTFSWDPVEHANGYTVLSSTGTGTLDGTTFTVNDLLPGQEVSIEVTSVGDTPCGPVVAQGSCTTSECPDISIGYTAVPVICQGEDVAIEITISGGPAGEIYTLDYSLNGAPQTTTIESNDVLMFTNVQADLEFAIVEFFGNSFEVCRYTNPQVLTITVNEPPEAGVALDPFEQCMGEEQVLELADLINEGDMGGSWTYPGGTLSGFDASAGTLTTTNLTEGEFSFEYNVSGNGICPDDRTVVRVIVHPNPEADAGIDQLIDCFSPTAVLESGNSGVSYNWSADMPGNLVGPVDQATALAGAGGLYFLTVTNEFGCTDMDEVEVLESFELPVPHISFSDISCFGLADGLIRIDSITGGVPPFEISLNGIVQSSLTNLEAGVYNIEITGANGCTVMETITINEPEELSVNIGAYLNAENLIVYGDSVLLEAIPQPGNRILDTILWTPAFPGSFNVWVKPTFQTTYTVTIIDENGCEARDELTIFVEKRRPVFIPNVFSPNDDGFNDIFYIQGGDQLVKVKSFIIFTRWGESVFELLNFEPNDPAFGWDGTHRGRELNSGVYVYLAEIEFNDGEVLIYKGDLALMR